VHEEICATHANRHMMAKQMQIAGYFLLSMEKDCINFVRRCHEYQVYSDKVNAPPAPLFNMVSPCPFIMWGIDMIGPIKSKASNGHRFILVAIDYFFFIKCKKLYRSKNIVGDQQVICTSIYKKETDSLEQMGTYSLKQTS